LFPPIRRLAAHIFQLLEQCNLVVGHEMQAVTTEKPQQLPWPQGGELGVGGEQSCHQYRALLIKVGLAWGQGTERIAELHQGVTCRQFF